MKTKRAELPVVIILVVVGVILVGLLVAWSTGVFKDKKQDLNSSTEKIDNALSSVADFDLLAYDDYTVKGESLKDLISELQTRDVQVSIGVATLEGVTSYYNYGFTVASNNLGGTVTITPPASKSDNSYITPSGNFLGKVIRNKNNEIVCLLFTQQK